MWLRAHKEVKPFFPHYPLCNFEIFFIREEAERLLVCVAMLQENQQDASLSLDPIFSELCDLDSTFEYDNTIIDCNEVPNKSTDENKGSDRHKRRKTLIEYPTFKKQHEEEYDQFGFLNLNDGESNDGIANSFDYDILSQDQPNGIFVNEHILSCFQEDKTREMIGFTVPPRYILPGKDDVDNPSKLSRFQKNQFDPHDQRDR